MKSLVTNVLHFKIPLERLNSLAAIDDQSRPWSDDQPPQTVALRHGHHVEICVKHDSPRLPSEPERTKPVLSREDRKRS